MSLFDELKRRHVFRAGIAYVVVAWLVLQVADVVLPNLGAPDWVFRGLLALLAIGFPVALVIAWIFELTPAGLQRESELDRPESQSGEMGRYIDFAIIAILAVAVGYFAYDKFVLSTAEADKSIAVLPFVNMSRDPEQEYFADGLSEELLNLLAQVPALRVIARTSSFSYKGREDATIAQIGSDLNVAHVLEGSVRKDADSQVRVTAQLIRADDQSHLWSDSYDRQMSDIFAIQDEIAESVVDELKIKLLGEAPRAREVEPEAYSLYLEARELSPDIDPVRSIALYQQALDIHTDYAAAWSGLAENFIYLAEKVRLDSIREALTRARCLDEPLQSDQGSSYYIDEAFKEARCSANTALKIDPELASAFASLGRIAMVRDGNLALAAKHLERALELDPANAQIIRQVAILSGNLNRVDEAVELLEFAAARDPVSPSVHNNLALNYYYAKQWGKAISAYRTVIELSPNPAGVHSWIGLALVFDNKPEAGLAEIMLERHPDKEKDHNERRPWRLIAEVMAYHALGRVEESDDSLEQFIEDYGDEWGFSVAYALAFRGENDRAFEWLNRAKQNNDSGLSEIASEPAFDNIKSDPRWLPFLESVGKAPEQLGAIQFKVTQHL
ncbi:MAG: tetratricopeptide repeat protein [Gammaproteobacteria bacterium]|nr:tetratricopeptide repeat protein [Gammaproteobacteria bacterium]